MITDEKEAAPPLAMPRAKQTRLTQVVDRFERLLRAESDFLILLVLFAAFRFMVLIMFRAGGHIVDFNSFYTFYDWARLSDQGFYPYFDFWMEHPPLAPWPAILAYRLSAFIPPWHDQYLWFSLLLGTILLPLEMGNLTLVYLLGRRLYDRATGFRCAWMYAALFVPVIVLRSDFDTYPLFFLLLSVYLVVTRRPAWAGVSIGVGFLVKILPILVLPVALRSFAGRLLPAFFRSKADDEGDASTALKQGVLLVTVTAATIGVLASPFLIANPASFVASFRNMASRPPWETVWALIDGYYSGGWVADPSVRFDPATAGVFDYTARFSWSWLVPAFAASYLGLLSLRGRWREPLGVTVATAAGLNLFLLLSKGYSPQFMVYLLPFVILAFPNLRGVVYVLALSGVNLLEYPFALTMLQQQHGFLTGVVITRTLLILLLTGDYLLHFLTAAVPAWWRNVSRVALVLFLCGLGYLGISAGRLYFAASLEQEQFKEAVVYLQSQEPATVLIADKGTYARLFPFLGRRHRVFYVEDERWPADIIPEKGEIYLFDGRSEADQAELPVLERFIAERAFPTETKWFANSRVLIYSAAGLTPKAIDWRLAHGIVLTGYAVEEQIQAGGTLHIALHWTAAQRPNADYSVFLHLTDTTGRIVAQRDSAPANGTRPTSQWEPGVEVKDNHGLQIPRDLSPGEYVLRVGMYNPGTGQRLGAESGEDQVVLARIEVK